MAANRRWVAQARSEIWATVEKYTPGDKASVPERLAKVPLEGWENDFPTVEVCLRESIRLQLAGSAFRRNISGKEIRINDNEVIPPDAFVVWLSMLHSHHRA
jgi:sterol 14-demethylase